MKVYGVSVVRDEADVIGVTIRHHLALGLDRVIVVDNGSTDSTPQILESFTGDPRFSWRSITTEGHPQAEIFTAVAREAHADGAAWLMPFDADEFWHTGERSVHELLGDDDADVLSAKVVNYVQDRHCTATSTGNLATMSHRAVSHGHGRSQNKDLVESGQVPYVCIDAVIKALVRLGPGVTIGMGGHYARGGAGQRREENSIRVLHAPLRSKAHLYQKARNGRRVAKVYDDPRVGWHSKRFARLEDEGRLESEWDANSQLGGHLHPPSGARAVVEDDTLVRTVSPWL